MSYAVHYRSGIEKDIARLPKSIQSRVDRTIMMLSENPRPAGCRKLSGTTHLWRVRVGEYRIVYEIDDREQVVDLQIVAHR